MSQLKTTIIVTLAAVTAVCAFATIASAQALALPLNGQASEFMSDSADATWWQVTLPSDGALTVSTHSDSTLDVDIYLYDTDGETYIDSSAAFGTDDQTDDAPLMPGTYYIEVKHWNGHGNYTISSTFAAASLANDPEPNNEATEASPLAANGSDTGHLGYHALAGSDVTDWWAVTVPSDGVLSVATHSDSTLDVDIYLYDTDRESYLGGSNGAGVDDEIIFTGLTPGTYYVQAIRWNGYGAYTITGTFAPTRYASDPEPNDTFETASGASVLTTWYGHLGHHALAGNDEDDIITFTVPANWDTLFIRSESDSTLDIDLYLYSADGQTPLDLPVASGPTEMLTLTGKGGMSCALKMHSFGTGWGGYALIISNSTAAMPNAGAVAVHDDTSAPAAFSLGAPYPNPFNPRTSMSFTTPESGRVRVVVYDILGRKTAVLLDDVVTPGMHTVTWDARDDAGNPSASGVYLIRVDAGNFHDQRKIMLMR